MSVGWGGLVDLGALVEELVEAHHDTIEIVSGADDPASELHEHVAYLKDLTRVTYAVLAHTAQQPRRAPMTGRPW
jgi:hypothetical protein